MATGLPHIKDNIFYVVKQILIYWHIGYFKMIDFISNSYLLLLCISNRPKYIYANKICQIIKSIFIYLFKQ